MGLASPGKASRQKRNGDALARLHWFIDLRAFVSSPSNGPLRSRKEAVIYFFLAAFPLINY